MANKRTDIAQIRKYLNGELDASAMHKLEREAQDDPFLMEALQGFEQKGKDPLPDLHQLKNRLADRIQQGRKKRVLLWPAIYMAASVLIFAAIGGWWLIRQTEPVKHGQVAIQTPKASPPAKAGEAVINQAPVIATNIKPKSAAPATVNSAEIPVAQGNATAEVAPPVAEVQPPVKQEDESPIDNAVKGRVAGVEVKQAQGAPGADKNIRIRGNSTLSKGSEPLYIVDGVPTGNIKNLKPDDIAKIDVLKDSAVSAGIYGSRGNNGVVIITTKQGATQLAKVKSDSAAKSKMLQEVIVMGYTAQKRRDVTGSVSTITTKDVRDKQDTTLQKALAGVSITRKNRRNKSAVSDSVRIVKGHVTAKDDNQALAGVSIRVKGTTTGTQTDMNGNFSIKAKTDNTLVFAYIGFKSLEEKIGKRDQLNVALETNGASLNEVVVVGYGQKRDDDTPPPVVNAHPGIGWKEFDRSIKDNIAPDGKKGKVRVKFTVNPDGSLTDFKVNKSLSPEDDAEAIRLIQQTSWTPRSNGEAETIRVTVKFKEK